MADIPLHPWLILLRDDTDATLNFHQKRIFMAALTASKMSILRGWFEASLVSLWRSYFLDNLILEHVTAKFHKVSPMTISHWSAIAFFLYHQCSVDH